MRRLERFFKANNIVVFGGHWALNVIHQLQKSGFNGNIWPVHPKRSEIAGLPVFRDVNELPGVPDAAFIGVNRLQTIDLLAKLSALEAGGAVCFASGFKEAQQHNDNVVVQADLQAQLLAAAGDMPILGPNCYGFINYLDNVVLWPDQHGGRTRNFASSPTQQGVAIIAQSSNIAINLTMQHRNLAISHVLTVGNQAMIGVSDLIDEMLLTEGVTAIGLYLEGIDDLPSFANAARRARIAGKPIVVIKIGKSEKSRLASITHTASLTGASASNSAMLQRLGIAEVDSLDVFLETLKLSHFFGATIKGNKVSSVSCSGGEASLMADLAQDTAIEFSNLGHDQQRRLQTVLGDKVALANPLDYHTYIWGDVPAMSECFTAVASGEFDLNVFVLDIPRADECETQGHQCAIDSIINAKRNTDAPMVVLASIPETLNESVSQEFIEAGVLPMHGMQTALQAISAMIKMGLVLNESSDLWVAPARAVLSGTTMLNEAEAKNALANYGVLIPQHDVFGTKAALSQASEQFNYPVVIKALGHAHKTEMNAVYTSLATPTDVSQALTKLPESGAYLVEEMVGDNCLELLLGINVDSTGIVLLTLGAGGTLTELLADTQSLVLPASQQQIDTAIHNLRCAPLLTGYRGNKVANVDALINTVQSVCEYVYDHLDSLIELDINPLIVGSQNTVAVDALIMKTNDSDRG